jgi:hypothetical protein
MEQGNLALRLRLAFVHPELFTLLLSVLTDHVAAEKGDLLLVVLPKTLVHFLAVLLTLRIDLVRPPDQLPYEGLPHDVYLCYYPRNTTSRDPFR